MRRTPTLPSSAPASLAGQLLIAMPGMNDPRFAHSVILLCAHDEEHAMGIAINTPMRGITVEGLLKQLGIANESLADPDQAVLFGGPVENERGFVLHSLDWHRDGMTLPVTPGVGLTTARDILEDMGQGAGPHFSSVAVGYAGWGPGQLEEELRANAWLTCAASRSLIFDDRYDDKWQKAIATLGVSAAHLSGHSGRA